VLRLGEQSPPALREGGWQGKMCLRGRCAAAEPGAGSRGSWRAAAQQSEGHTDSSGVSGMGYLSWNMALTLRCYALYRMLFLYRMIPVTGCYSWYSQELILERGKEGKKLRWRRWGQELSCVGAPSPPLQPGSFFLLSFARLPVVQAEPSLRSSLPFAHWCSNRSSAKGRGFAEKLVSPCLVAKSQRRDRAAPRCGAGDAPPASGTGPRHSRARWQRSCHYHTDKGKHLLL